MPAHRSNSPELIILSTDPPTTSPKSPVSRHMSTGGPALLRAQAAKKLQAAKLAKSAASAKRANTRMSASYRWPAKAILAQRIDKYKIDYRPAFLTPAEYDFWSIREEFLSESFPDARGRVRVVFAPSWQPKSYASSLLRSRWNDGWEKVPVLSEEL
ncbi:hypothetical protein P7C70_g973, partial [Phenoliferia sp. Uapishka_3]